MNCPSPLWSSRPLTYSLAQDGIHISFYLSIFEPVIYVRVYSHRYKVKVDFLLLISLKSIWFLNSKNCKIFPPQHSASHSFWVFIKTSLHRNIWSNHWPRPIDSISKPSFLPRGPGWPEISDPLITRLVPLASSPQP